MAEPEADGVEPAKDAAADAFAEEAADAAAEGAAVQNAQANSHAYKDPAFIKLSDFYFEEEPVWSRRLRSGRVVQVVFNARSSGKFGCATDTCICCCQ